MGCGIRDSDFGGQVELWALELQELRVPELRYKGFVF